MELPKIGKKGAIIIISGLLVGCVIAFTLYVNQQIKLLKDSCWAIIGVIIRKLSLESVELTLLLKLMNRSDLAITVGKQKYLIYVNDMYVATVSKEQGFAWASQSTKTLPLDIVFNPQELLKTGVQNIVALLGDKTKFKITIKGIITAKSGIISVSNLTFDTTYTLAELLAPTPDILECKNFK
jgi:LEA14-like dessication related protein